MNIFNYRRCGVVITWIGGKIMLSERKKGKFRGHYGVAGGKIEAGEDILKGVCREFIEETGAFLYEGYVRFIDCYVIKHAQQKVFIFESRLSDVFWTNIKNPEPHKHSPWRLYTREEALKLNLMPYIREYLEHFDEKEALKFNN